MTPLVLSLFPGLGLLDRAFEEEGFCVVRGPDVLWGGDVRRFHPPAGVFAGVIGGPPCQAFSPLSHMIRNRWGEDSVPLNLIPEYERCVAETQPAWFVMENSPFAPLPVVEGYQVRAVVLNNRWLAADKDAPIGPEQTRKRRISFGTRDGCALSLDVCVLENPVRRPAVLSSPGKLMFSGAGKPKSARSIEWQAQARTRTVADMAELQGLPRDFLEHAPFTSDGKRHVIANGVPLPMGRAIARAVKRAMYPTEVVA